MKTFKRITTTVSTSFDRLLDRIENHEAVAEVAVRDLRLALATSKRHLEGLERSTEKIRGEFRAAQHTADKWRARATKTDIDQAQALECLRRARRADTTAKEKAKQLETAEKSVAVLKARHQDARVRFAEMESRVGAMKTRDALVVASQSLDGVGTTNVHGVLDRWEHTLRVNELLNDDVLVCEASDAFTQRFDEEEEHIDLQEELAALRRDAAKKNADLDGGA